MEKFTKVKNIGKGNMGACALARNNEDGRYYVIKQVDLAKLNKKERQQSLNEAKVLSSLRHPNVINYFDSFLARKSDHLCIVMEFADGGDLSNRIKNNHGINFSETQVLDWFIQIVFSLHYVHQRKILHRDVKTQNIFLTQENLCKLGDFGIARTLNSTYDQASTFVGTPYYLSPELILERPYDHMSDVWALGVVLYELLALRHPFNANDMKSLMHRILKVQYEPPPAMYSSELRSIVARILVKDPLQRIRLGEILELPIVTKRVRQWIDGGILPSRYLGALIRSKLLPPHLLAYAMQTSAVGATGGSNTASPTHYLQQQQQQQQQPQSSDAIQPSRSPDKPAAMYGGGGAPYAPQAAPINAPRPQPVVLKKDLGEYDLQPQPSGVARYGGISPAPLVTPAPTAAGVDYRRQKPLAMAPSAPPESLPDYQVYRPRAVAELPPTNVLRPAAALPPLNSAVGVAVNAGGGGGGGGGVGVYRAYQAQQEYNPPPRGGLAPVVVHSGGGGVGGVPPIRPPNVGGGMMQQNPYTSGAGVAAAIYGNQQRSAAVMQQQQIQQHNNDIQAMLQRAALERAQRQKMLR